MLDSSSEVNIKSMARISHVKCKYSIQMVKTKWLYLCL